MSSRESDPRLPKVDELLDGKYHILRILGEGGMGVVYEAMHKRLRHRVAIKTILPKLLSEPGFVERFEREARAASQIRGPNVAKVIDVDILPSGLPYIVMEYLEGHDLATELRERGRLPLEEAVGFVLDACKAMEEAHAMGIIHRDLKPSNLYLCADQGRRVVKVLDFGISKMTSDSDSGMTATQTTIGTPLYMSPEQIRSAKRVDGRTDIWALGVILYEAIAGRPPFTGSPTAVAASIVADEPEPIATYRSEVPPALAAVIHKALAKDMTARFADVAEMMEALQPFVVDGWRPLANESAAASHRVINSTGDRSATSGEAPTEQAARSLTPTERAKTTPVGMTPAASARSVTTAAPLSSQRPVKPQSRAWMTALAIVVPIVLGVVYLATRARDGGGTAPTANSTSAVSTTLTSSTTTNTTTHVATATTSTTVGTPSTTTMTTTVGGSTASPTTTTSFAKPPTTITKPTAKPSASAPTAAKSAATAPTAPPTVTAPPTAATEPPVHI